MHKWKKQRIALIICKATAEHVCDLPAISLNIYENHLKGRQRCSRSMPPSNDININITCYVFLLNDIIHIMLWQPILHLIISICSCMLEEFFYYNINFVYKKNVHNQMTYKRKLVI